MSHFYVPSFKNYQRMFKLGSGQNLEEEEEEEIICKKKNHISPLGMGDIIIRNEGNEKFGQTIYRQLLLADSFKVV